MSDILKLHKKFAVLGSQETVSHRQMVGSGEIQVCALER